MVMLHVAARVPGRLGSRWRACMGEAGRAIAIPPRAITRAALVSAIRSWAAAE